MKALRLAALLPFLIGGAGTVAADVVFTSGDFGVPDPAVMVHESRGVYLTNPESWVFSHAVIPYPSELAGATTLELTFYFIPDADTQADVDFEPVVGTKSAGDDYHGFPAATVDDPAPVSVSGPDTRIYSQKFKVTSLPTPRDLLHIGVHRLIFGSPATDTYPTGVYLFAVKIEDVSVATRVGDRNEADTAPPLSGSLRAAPNPFHGETTVSYQVRQPGRVMIHVYNVQGRLVDTIDRGHQNPGEQRFTWNAPEAASGMYFLKVVQGGDATATRIVKIE